MQIGYGLSAAALGGAVVHPVDELQAERTAAKRWASTTAPQAAQGSVRAWWSADAAVGRQVALTFDDGPTEQFTAHVLDLLERAGIPATFFVIGALAQRHPDLLRRARDAGHEGKHRADNTPEKLSDFGDRVQAQTQEMIAANRGEKGWFTK